MEKKLLRYFIIVVIFFIGLSLGVSHQDKSRLQKTLDSYEKDITTPGNNFKPVNPVTDIDDKLSQYEDGAIQHNLFTSLAKDGEYIVTKGLDLILDISNEIFRFIFGIK